MDLAGRSSSGGLEANSQASVGAASGAPKSPEINKFDLKATQELRIQIGEEESVKLRMLSGTAEIFGTEIVAERWYQFSKTKIAVFTWNGCILEISGKYTSAYIGQETPMDSYMNVHFALQKLRIQASEEKKQGPRVMLVGPTDSGKSSLSRILLNYAVRSDMRPSYVDLDVALNAITPPGCIAAIPIFRPVDVEDGLPLSAPLSYFYGHENYNTNPASYKSLVNHLAKALNIQAEKDPIIKASGLIINTPSWVEGLGYQLIVYVAEVLGVTHILTLDDEKLRSDLHGDINIQRRRIVVVHLPKSGGVVKRDTESRRLARKNKIYEYFHGTKGDLHPHTNLVKFDTIKVYRIGPDPRLPQSALPLGVSLEDEPLKPYAVPISRELLNAVLAIVHAQSEEELSTANVAGFAHVTYVDLENRTLRMTKPCDDSQPLRFYILGSIRHMT